MRFVADHQPVALVILASCHVGAEEKTWTPYLALDDGEPFGVAAVAVGVALSLYLSAGFRRTGAMSGIEPVLELDVPTNPRD